MTCEEAREYLPTEPERAREHLEGCAACRREAEEVAVLRARLLTLRSPPPSAVEAGVLALGRVRPGWGRGSLLRMAAAFLLLAGGSAAVLALRKGPSPLASAGGSADPVLRYPVSLAPSRTEALTVSRGLGLVAAAGARTRLASADRLEVEAGRLLVHVSRGTPIEVATPFGICMASQAAFEIRCGASGSALVDLLMGRAWAEGLPEGELLVVRGSVDLRSPAGNLSASAGQEVRLRQGKLEVSSHGPEELAALVAWADGDAPWTELWTGDLSGWERSGAGRCASEGGRLLLDASGDAGARVFREVPAGVRFVWTATIRRLGGGFLEVDLPAPAQGETTLTLGELPQLGDGRDHELTLRLGFAPVLLLDGCPLRDLPCGTEGAVARVGLGVRNGTLEVRGWRWRTLP